MSHEILFRRAPDVGGFNWWTSQLDTGAMSRTDVLNNFFGSAEWQARINHVAGTCILIRGGI